MGGFNGLRIGARLGIGFGSLLLGVAVLVGVVLMQLSGMATRVNALADVGVKELVDLGKFTTSLSERAVASRHLVLEGDPARHTPYLEQIKRSSAAVDAGLKELAEVVAKGSSMRDAQMRQMVAGIRETEQKYLAVVASIAEAATSGRKVEAADRLLRECKPMYEQILSQSQALEREIEKTVQEYSSSADAAYDQARMATLGLAAVIILVGGVAAWVLTRSIVDPLRTAVAAARAAAAGDLSRSTRVRRQDETGELLMALNAMTENLARVVAGVRSAADAIATGTGQIASGNADLSQRTETQASNLQETAASMEELNTTVRHNAETASQAAELARAASDAAERGGSAVGQVVSTMEAISHSSRKVVDIIAVIDGIAFQTNILALNAAVEAARAGEQGRGFAVVAGEVRVLAQRSAAAAKEIKQLIAASTDRVGDGTRLVADAGRAMDDILAQVRRVNDLIEGINQATAQQTAGIGQVNSAVSQLDQATQQNAALVEQSAAAAESLRQQARGLVDAVGAFTLPADVVAADSIAKAAASSRSAALPALASPRSAAIVTAKPRPAAASQGRADGDWDTF